VSLNDPIDTTTAVGVAIFQFCAVMAELEKSIIRERTKASLQSARTRGSVGGAPRCRRPTVVFECGFHESCGIAHRVLCDPSKTAAQPAFTLDAACDNVVFPQAHHSVGSHIGSIDRNAKVSCRCNGFAPWPHGATPWRDMA
jgi:hypothetical protein